MNEQIIKQSAAYVRSELGKTQQDMIGIMLTV